MKFAVIYKGVNRFTGRLEFAMRYLEQHWGSATDAYEFGVKLVPSSEY